MPAILMTVIMTILKTVGSMLLSVLLSPRYIKKVALIALGKLKSLAHGRQMDSVEKAIDEAEEVLEKDPDLQSKE